MLTHSLGYCLIFKIKFMEFKSKANTFKKTPTALSTLLCKGSQKSDKSKYCKGVSRHINNPFKSVL